MDWTLLRQEVFQERLRGRVWLEGIIKQPFEQVAA